MTNTTRSTLRRLALTTALAGGALSALPAAAQVNTPTAPDVQVGAGVTFSGNGLAAPVVLSAGDGAATAVNGAGTTLDVDLGGNAATVINWGSFNVSSGSTLSFTAPTGPNVAVLNRVTAIDRAARSQIEGSITSGDNVAVWLSNPNGIFFGAGGAVNAGSFVATTLNITDADFTAGALSPGGVRMTGGPDSGRIILDGVLNSGGSLVLVAPRIGSSAALTAESVGFVVATDATIAAQPASPLGIIITAGTPIPKGAVIAGTINGETVYVAGARPDDGLSALLRIDGNITATPSATGSIIIAAGPQTSGGLTIADNASTNGTFNVITNGALTGGVVSILGNSATRVQGDVTSTGALDITGASVLLGLTRATRQLSAADGITITASEGPVRSVGALSLLANTDGLGAPGAVRVATRGAAADILLTGSSINAGAGRLELVTADAGGLVRLGDVIADRLVSAIGAGPFLEGLTRATDLTAGNVSLASGPVLLTAIGAADLRTGNVSSGSSVTLRSANALGTGTISGTVVDLDWGAAGASTGAITTSAGGLTASGAGRAVIAGATLVGGGAIITTTDAGAGLSLTGGLSAEGAVTLTAGGSIAAPSVATTTGDVVANYAGSLAGVSGGRAALSTGAGAVDVNGGPGARLGAVSATTTVDITADAIDAGDVTAGGAVTATGVSGARLGAVSGTTVNVAADLIATGVIIATDAVTLAGGAGGVTTAGLTGGLTTVTTPGVARLNGVSSVAGGSAFSGDAGLVFGSVTGNGDLSLTSATGGVSGTSATAVGGALTANGETNLAIGSAGATGGAVTLSTDQAGGLLSVGSLSGDAAGVSAVAQGDLSVGALTVTGGGATLTAFGTDAALGSADVSGNLDLGTGAGGSFAVTGAVAVGGDLTLATGAGGAASVAGNTTIGGNLAIDADQIALGGAPGVVMQANGRITLTSSVGVIAGRPGLTLISDADSSSVDDGISIDSASAIVFGGTSLIARPGGGASLGLRTRSPASVVLGTVLAGQVGGLDGVPATFTPTYLGEGDFTADAITASTLGVDLTAGTIAIGALTTSGAATLDTDGAVRLGTVRAEPLTVRAGGGFSAADLETDGDITLTSTTLVLDRLVSRSGSVSATATQGLLSIGTTGAGTSALLQATGAGNVSLGTVTAGTTATITSAQGSVGVNSVSAATQVTVTTPGSIANRAGNVGATLTASDGGVRVDAGGEARLLEVTAGGAAGVIGLSAGELSVASATAGATLNLLTRRGDLLLGEGSAAGDATIVSAAAARIDRLTGTGGLTVDTAGALDATLLDVTGAAAIDAGTIATIDTLAGASVTVAADVLSIRQATSATNLDLTSRTGPLSLAIGEAGTTATLDAATALTVGSRLTANGAATLIAGEGATVGAVTSTTGLVSVAARSARIGIATAATTLTVDASADDLALSEGRAASAVLTAGGDIGIGTLTTTGAARLEALGTITGGSIAAGGTAFTRSGGATVLDTVTGAGIDVAGASLAIRVADTPGVLLLGSVAGPLTLGTGTAGQTATLTSAGALTVENRLQAAGLVDLRAAGAARITQVESTGAAVQLTAVSADVIDARAATALTLAATAGDLALSTGTAGTTATLSAVGAVRASTVTSGNAATITGTAVRLGQVTTTDGAIRVTAVNGVGGIADLGQADLIAGGSGGVTVDTGGAARLGTVSGTGVIVEAQDIFANVVRASAGHATLTADGGSIFAGAVDAAGSAGLRASSFVTADRIAAALDATVLAGTGSTVAVLNGRTVRVEAGNLSLGNVTATADLALATTAGSLTVRTAEAAGNATLASAATLAVTGAVNAGGTVTTRSVGASDIAAAASRTADVDLRGQSVSAGRASAATALTIAASNGNASVGTGSAGTTATLAASGGDALVGAALTSAGGTTVSTDRTARLANLAVGNGPLSVVASGDVFAGNLTTGTGAAGTLTVSAGGAAQIGIAQSSGALSLAAGTGPLTVGSALAPTAAVTLRSGGALSVGERVLAGGVLDVQAGGAIAIADADSTGADIRVRGQSVSVGSAEAASLSLASTGGGVTLGNGTISGAATLASAGGDTVVTGALATGGAATITSSAGAQLAGVTTTNGALSVTASGNVAAGTLTAGQGNALTVTAGGAAQIGTATGGAVALTAATGPLLLATGTTGSASLSSGGALTVSGSLNATDAVSTASSGATGIAAVEGSAVTLRGQSVNAGTATARTGALSVTSTGGNASVGTGVAGTTATLAATGGDAVVGTRLSSGGATTITAAANARLAEVATTNGALTITAGGAVSGTVDRATLSAGGANSVLSVTAGGAARLGTVTGGTRPANLAPTATGNDVVVRAASIDVADVFANGALNARAASGELAIGTGRVAGAATLEAAGTARLGTVSAGSSIAVSAGNAEITGVQSAPAITVVNRTPGTQPMRLGNGLAGGGFALDDAELDRFQTPSLTLQGGSGAVEIGALSLTGQAGSSALNVLTTGTVRVTGTVTGSGAGRAVRIGGTDAPTGKASEIRIVTQPSGGGRLLLNDATLDLRGVRIAQGQANLTDALLNGGGLSADQAAAQFTSNANSALYAPILGGRLYDQNATTTISAGRLTVAYDVFALFQNTGLTGFNLGAVIGGTVSTTPNVLVLSGAGATVPNTFALFGSINGIGDQSASVLGSNVLVTDSSVNIANTRLNGCVIGSGAGCITTTVAQPALNVFDRSRIDVLSSAEDFAVPFDPVIGGNNEALFAGVSAIDVPITGTECEDGSTDPQCTGGSNQETRP